MLLTIMHSFHLKITPALFESVENWRTWRLCSFGDLELVMISSEKTIANGNFMTASITSILC